MFEELSEIDNVPLMERLKHKAKLIKSLDELWLSISANKRAYPKGFERTSVKSLMKDFKKGLKVIDKKNPVFIEMPTLKKAGTDGYVKKDYSLPNGNPDEVIEVRLPPTSDIKYIENG
ncbi:MAG: hypothetical protein E7351_01590 [Clostridiales bacterium]|nr:hypothetical protein [Clostridiales bacterium]